MKRVLPVIVFAQFAGTSLWFASNAILDDILESGETLSAATANLTSAVQLGFIAGTLLFAFSNVADRFSARRVFLISTICASLFNILPVFSPGGNWSLYISRCMTGFFLAGVYPVGMKIAADWYREGLGKALGYLVGALVLGTAFPHFLNMGVLAISWSSVLIGVSILAVAGAITLYVMVPEGPYRHTGSVFRPNALYVVFKRRDFRSAAFGYFGHMWELYTFWAFVPILLYLYQGRNTGLVLDISMWSFLIIGAGSIGCVVGGLISLKYRSAKVAFVSLAISFLCCMLSFWSLEFPPFAFLLFMLIWGFTVVGDSPQFSALNAKTAPVEWIGSALTIATCIGFSITIASIQLLKFLEESFDLTSILWILALGPLLGLIETWRLVKKGY